MNKVKKILALVISAVLLVSLLSSCRDSGNSTNVVQVAYDPTEEIAPYLKNLPELTEADKNYVVQLGFFDCDHMVTAIIGQDAGIYEALGLNVVVTKTNQQAAVVASGEFDAAYVSYTSAINAYNNGAELITLIGSHQGGARYFVVRDDIKSTSEIKSLTVSDMSMVNSEWLRFADEVGITSDYTAYTGASMSQPDSLVALKAEQIDGIFVCDPFASIAEQDGFGKIINVAWGSLSEDLNIGWGQCCTEMFNQNFVNDHPALAARLVLAHCLSVKYMYTHPYNAAMMFADTFGTTPDVGLRTIYLKTNAEGRTMSWEISPQNIKNLCDYRAYWEIPEKEWPQVTRGNVEDFFDHSFINMIGMESFDEFLNSSGIADNFPSGMSYTEWLNKAEDIDGIDHESTVGKKVDKWMKNEVITALPVGS